MYTIVNTLQSFCPGNLKIIDLGIILVTMPGCKWQVSKLNELDKTRNVLAQEI